MPARRIARSLTAPKTPTPPEAELDPRGRYRVLRQPNCEERLKSYGHPWGITISSVAAACHPVRRLSTPFLLSFPLGQKWRFQPLICISIGRLGGFQSEWVAGLRLE